MDLVIGLVGYGGEVMYGALVVGDSVSVE